MRVLLKYKKINIDFNTLESNEEILTLIYKKYTFQYIRDGVFLSTSALNM